MTPEWTSSELEILLQVDEKREWLAEAYSRRLALPTIRARVDARLSQFLTDHQVAWCWFVNDEAKIPICSGWERENPKTPSHHWETRYVHNDMLVGEWIPLSEAGKDVTSLTAYLRRVYERDPDLSAAGWSPDIVEDFTHRHQYRCVICPKLKMPLRTEIANILTLVPSDTLDG